MKGIKNIKQAFKETHEGCEVISFSPSVDGKFVIIEGENLQYTEEKIIYAIPLEIIEVEGSKESIKDFLKKSILEKEIKGIFKKIF